ncbi:hypothetical protein [Anaeroselena agilis]|uniref:Uncharacterized protein n=1 Tax=Anaeroselena agilis TaxID=3063788 RepID=A0ABU3P1U1_9FIRM|nr:hypothetical protein [Selenomonadales bacterium 4137-cl]
MNYLYLLAALCTGVHALSYGLWLLRQGNRPGALFVFGLSLGCVALPAYRLFAAP